MYKVLELIMSPDFFVVPIVIVSFVGALIGETQKEVDNDKDIVLYKFISAFFSSCFLGCMTGLVIYGIIFYVFHSNNICIIIGVSGYYSYVGYKKSVKVFEKIFKMIIKFKLSSGDDDDE